MIRYRLNFLHQLFLGLLLLALLGTCESAIAGEITALPETVQPLSFNGAKVRAIGGDLTCDLSGSADSFIWLKRKEEASSGSVPPLPESTPNDWRYLAQAGGVRIRLPNGGWDLSQSTWLAVDIKNEGRKGIFVNVELVGDPKVPWKSAFGGGQIGGGKTRTIWIRLHRKLGTQSLYLHEYFTNKLHAVHGAGQIAPGWRSFSLKSCKALSIHLAEPSGDEQILIKNPRGAGKFNPPSEAELAADYFPCVDEFGQFRHTDWPEKITSVEGLQAASLKEDSENDSRTGPADRSLYGGWLSGPRLEATGHFRTEKYANKWWLVDPEGYLFWSFGPTGVTPNTGRTQVANGKHTFAQPPKWKKSQEPFRGKGWWNPIISNLCYRDGELWLDAWAERQHIRLKNWGFNTIGNWSSPNVMRSGKTPYVVAVNYKRPSLGTSRKSLPDCYAEDFFDLTIAGLKEAGSEAAALDPFCLGFFIDNELPISQPNTPALNILKSPPNQPAKQAFIKYLRKKHGTIDNLNQAWQTEHADWQDVLKRVNPPKPTTPDYQQDCRAFSREYLDRYYRLCAKAVKQAAPQKLYLGSRINHYYNADLIRASAKYCDVISMNIYQFSVRRLPLPEGIDKPVIIGEYNFGAEDRGVPSTTSTGSVSVDEAATAMGWYIRGALDHPAIVGAHWFTYYDQPVMGRNDGENGRIGFVDVTDQPYEPMVKMARQIGEKLYEARMEPRGH